MSAAIEQEIRTQAKSSPYHYHLCITCGQPVNCDCDEPENGGNEHVWCREGMTFNQYNRSFRNEF
jgi:hypothetical protein